MLQQQLNQVKRDKEDRIKSTLRLKCYMEELEKGILVSAVAFRGESGSVLESLPEGDILKFSPSELEQFLEDRREVMNKLLVSLKDKRDQETELGTEAAEATLQFVRELKEKSEGQVTLQEREDQVEVLEERVEDLTNQLEDSRHNEEKYQMKVSAVVCDVSADCHSACVCTYIRTYVHICSTYSQCICKAHGQTHTPTHTLWQFFAFDVTHVYTYCTQLFPLTTRGQTHNRTITYNVYSVKLCPNLGAKVFPH